MLNDPIHKRYHRQIILDGFGESGQRKLIDAKVLVIGAGGLGCPALLYLSAAGVGHIGIVDDDVVSIENLHRQILFTTEDIGLSKTHAATKRLKALTPEIDITEYPFRLTPKSCIEIFPNHDIILDCTDNFATRYMINDACVLLNKPLVSAAVSQYEGQLAVFQVSGGQDEEPVNYRDLFPEPPPPGLIRNCGEAGILGVLAGIIGTLQANETIKLITGIGVTLANRLLTFDIRTNTMTELKLTRNDRRNRSMPADTQAFLRMDHEGNCYTGTPVVEIGPSAFDMMLKGGDVVAVDVREPHEEPSVTEFEHLRLSLSVMLDGMHTITARRVVFFCQSGVRSLQAASILTAAKPGAHEVFSLRGGIIAWKAQYKKS
jgi:adenylyltransferase/sulfurtransferase